MFKSTLTTPGHERVFIRQALFSNGLRIDGRSADDLRSVSVKATRSETSSTGEAQLGTTTIIAVVTGTMVAPYPDKPNEGSLHFNTEISPLTEALGVTHAEISRLLERIVRDSEALDTDSLCIISGEKVWEIRCEVRVVDASGGNIIDACVLAVMAALKAFRKPEVSIVKTEYQKGQSSNRIVVHHSDEREPLPLSLQHTPLSITLGIFKKSNSAADGDSKEGPYANDKYVFIVDPSSQEDQAIDGKMSFSLNSFRELCAVSKPGGISLPVQEIMKAANICLRKVKFFHEKLTQALADLEVRSEKEREIRQIQLRQYTSMLPKTVDTNEEVTEEEIRDASGIDRNDPILDWNYLHKAVSVREK